MSGLTAWGLLEPFVLANERHDVVVPDLPRSWEGKRVTVLADLHIGMRPSGNRAVSSRAIRRVIRERPDLVLLAGDLVHDERRWVQPAVEVVRPLVAAGIPVYAVLGNHDYAMPTRKDKGDPEVACELSRALDAAGVILLDNEAVLLPSCGDTASQASADEQEAVWLVGLAAQIPGAAEPGAAFDSVPPDAPRLVMMHHPASFADLPGHAAPMAVAGHTHGGQVRLPLAPIWSYLTYAKDMKVFVSGWINSESINGFGEEGNNLYVTRGVGCSVLPMRLFCPPEITTLTLHRAPPDPAIEG